MATRTISESIALVAKSLREIEPRVGGPRLEHRYAVKHAADELVHIGDLVAGIELRNALQAADLTERDAKITQLNTIIRTMGGGQ
jgi:hypothetical protein